MRAAGIWVVIYQTEPRWMPEDDNFDRLRVCKMAAWSNSWVCGRSLAGIVGSNSTGGVCCECCLLTGRGFCDGLITRREESYRVCVCP